MHQVLPDMLDNRDEFAFQLVPKAMNAIFGPQNEAWHTVRQEWYGKEKTFIKAGPLDRGQGNGTENPNKAIAAEGSEAVF